MFGRLCRENRLDFECGGCEDECGSRGHVLDVFSSKRAADKVVNNPRDYCVISKDNGLWLGGYLVGTVSTGLSVDFKIWPQKVLPKGLNYGTCS